MALDDQIRQALDRALATARGHMETDLRALAQDLARAATDDRHRAVTQAAEAAAAEVRQKAHQQLTHIRDAAEKHTDEVRRAAESQLAELRRTLEETGRRAQVEIEDAQRIAQTQVDDVQRSLSERLTDLQGRLADTERRLNDATRDLEAARKTEPEHTSRLANAIWMLDDARSLGEVLDVLAQAAGREAERVAVMIVRGDRVAGWSASGFGGSLATPRTTSLELDAAGIIGTVARSGASASRRGTGRDLPPFARDGGPRDAAAEPVIVGGVPVAVLYADVAAGDPREREGWHAVLEVLARHASKVLEALTVQQAVGLLAPRSLGEGGSVARPLARTSHDGLDTPGVDRSVQ